MKWAQLSDFSLTLPDRPGELARLAAKMRAADVNLVGLWGYGGDGDVARFYCVPESADQFRSFAVSAELDAEEGTTFFLSGADEVGALVKTLERIAEMNINLRAIQAVGSGGDVGCFIWAAPADWERLIEQLRRQET